MWWSLAAAFFSGMAASLGLGGGGILLLYLVLALGMEQLEAQGINLAFFLPCALIALIFYTKKRMVAWRRVLPLVAGGVLGSLLGVWLAGVISSVWLGRLFGGFLLLLGLRELFGGKAERAAKAA
jgi:uncharacterized membrane protein YfcA